MAKPVLVQLHTTIDPDLMAEFKHLCQSANYPISVGTAIKRLMKKSVKEQQLPGEKINNDKALQELIYNYLLDDVNVSELSVHLNSVIMHHRGTKAQERTIKDVERIAQEVVPEPKGATMYSIAMTRDYFQVILFDYMMSERVLIQHMHAHTGQHSNESVFLSKLGILADLLAPIFQQTKHDKQTWFDASGVLVKKLPILGQRWRDLMYRLTSSKDVSKWRIVLNWYLRQYIRQHAKSLTKFDEDRTTFKPSSNMDAELASIIRQLQEMAHEVTALGPLPDTLDGPDD